MTSAPLRSDMEQHQPQTNKDIFQDPTLQEAMKTDAFARFILKHWKSLLGVLIAASLAMVAANIFVTTATTKRAGATAQLLEVQRSYRSIIETQDSLSEMRANPSTDTEKQKETLEKIATLEKELAESRTKLALMIDSLESPDPFPVLANLYRGLMASRFDDTAELAKTLDEIDGWKSVERESPERYVAELAALGIGRAALQTETLRKRGEEALKELASEGSRVGVDALVTLSYVTTEPTAKAALKPIYDSIKGNNPSRTAELDEIASRMSW